MHVFPTEHEIAEAAELLTGEYGVSAQLLGRLFGTNRRNEANRILQALGREPLRRYAVAALLIRRKGPALFAGSANDTRRLRYRLLKQLPDEMIIRLFGEHGPPDREITDPARMRTNLARRRWFSGKKWPRDFVEALRFPTVFSGMRKDKRPDTIVDVQPLAKPPELKEFQQELMKRMTDVLERKGPRTRCVVTLPTGGGKTRVAVEAFIEWMKKRFADGKYLVWIAQSEELCEQAIACIEQMWGAREYVAPLRIYRYFGNRSVPTNDLVGGVVVASIQKLYSRVKQSDPAVEVILRETGAMIIDEAHRAVTRMYNAILDRATDLCGADLFPICGLTATPGRASAGSEDGTRRLVNRFQAYLVKPDLGGAYDADPLEYFREHRFLARARHRISRSGRVYELTDSELAEIEREADESAPPVGFLRRLAEDRDRNLFILRELLALPSGMPTLVYACTVDHAYLLADLLRANGRLAGAISADTPMPVRRAMLREFREGSIEFICNFGVLTTGFDAPKTECIAIARPTTSEVLYEQIVGRGLRGPEFGGTEECLIIDFADNITRLGRPLAYERFKDFWDDEVPVEESSDHLVPAGG